MGIVFGDGEDGFLLASVPDIPGVHSQGQTREEARVNVIDALETLLTPDGDDPAEGDTETLVLEVNL